MSTQMQNFEKLTSKLLEERSQAISRLEELNQEEGWTTDNQAEWDKLEAQVEQLTEQLAGHQKRAEAVGELRKKAEGLVAKGLKPGSPGFQQAIDGGLVPGQYAKLETEKRSRLTFRDLDTGQIVEARRSDESCAEPELYRSKEANEFLAWERDTPHAVGELIRAVMTSDFDAIPWQVRQQGGGTDPAGGYFLTTLVSSRLIDLARAQSVLMRAGSATLSMGARDVRLVKVVTDPTMAWKVENAEVPATETVFGEILLSAKTCIAVIPSSEELMQDSANAAAAIQQVAARALANELDRAGLVGSGTGEEPQGLMNDPDVPVSTSTAGAISDHTFTIDAIASLYSNNFDGNDLSPVSQVHSPAVAAAYDSLVSSGDGQYLVPSPWAGQIQRHITSKMLDTEHVVGDFRENLLGTRMSARLQLSNTASYLNSAGSGHVSALSAFQQVLQIVTRIDWARTRPTWFAKTTGITGV